MAVVCWPRLAKKTFDRRRVTEATGSSANDHGAGCVNFCEINCGAVEKNNLEPFDSDALLSELETWAHILEGEPEVVRRLAAFAQAAQDDGDIEPNSREAEPTPEPSP